jgi:RNA polymerase sigma-70 factor (ECF subfamily)
MRRRKHLALLAEEEREARVESEETTLERAQEAAMARKAVDALAERDRLALLMREEGLEYTEIAEALELSPGSVGTTLSRARRRLVESYETLQKAQDEREKNAAS